jgi:hypothetical protein
MPAQVVVGKETFTKRAARNEKFNGFEAGVIVRREGEAQLEYRKGSLVLADESLVGGWATVYRKDWETPIEHSVSYIEYKGPAKSLWDTKPGTMIRKVALVQALREAFPDDFAGLYDEVELQRASDGEAVSMPEAKEKPVKKAVEVEAEVVEEPEPEPEPEPIVEEVTEAAEEGWEEAEDEGPEVIIDEPEAEPVPPADDAEIEAVKKKCLAGLKICYESGYLTDEQKGEFEEEISKESIEKDAEALKKTHFALQEIYMKKSRGKK